MKSLENLREVLGTVEAEAAALEAEREDLTARNSTLARELEECRAAQRPAPAPEQVPDVRIMYDGTPLVPTGPGELWPLSGERRWFWDMNGGVRVILDCKGTQRRVILQRAGGGMDALPPLLVSLKVVLEGGAIAWDGPVRIHHHARHCKTFRRLPMPRVDAQEMRRKALIPNYKPQNLDGSVPDRWEWRPWEQSAEASRAKANAWTERFGLVPRSWVHGVPLANEASMISPWDAILMLSGDAASPELWEICADMAETIGNYAVHYYDQATSAPYACDSSAARGLPVLNADNLPAMTTETGFRLPVADLAHEMALPNVMALITGERFYVEALETMVLLGSLAREGDIRASGIYWAGQVRGTAWWLRSLYHLCRVGVAGSRFLPQLRANLDWMAKTFADPAAVLHRQTGLCEFPPHKKSIWMQYVRAEDAATGRTASTGNLHFLAHVLGEIHRSGIVGNAAEPMLRHVLKAARGTWEASPSRYLAGWLQHSATGTSAETWGDITARTFAGLAPPSNFAPPLTSDIIAWHRAAAVVAADLGEAWGAGAAGWIDGALAAQGRKPGIVWQIDPRQ